MSGASSQEICPICGEQMDTYSDYKPFDNVFGECLNCGFTYYTKVEQLSLKELNIKREEYNKNMELKGKERLKPLTQKHLNKFKKAIKEI